MDLDSKNFLSAFRKFLAAERIPCEKTPFDSEQREKYAEYRGRSTRVTGVFSKFCLVSRRSSACQEPDGKKTVCVAGRLIPAWLQVPDNVL